MTTARHRRICVARIMIALAVMTAVAILFSTAKHPHDFMELTGAHYEQQRRVTLEAWSGKPRVILFWRSDCAPCLKEMAALPQLAQAHADMPILLIALENVQKTQAHLTPLPANVHALVAQADSREVLKTFGNDRQLALPYSLMQDAKGKPCGQRFGILAQENLKQWRKACSTAT